MKSNAILIDAENIDCTTKMLLDCLNKYEKVYLVFAHLLKKLSFNDLADLCHYIKDGRLNIIKMDSIGPNSADMGLSFIAGKLSSVMEFGSHIEILSKDQLFSNTVSLLKRSGFSARQVRFYAKKNEFPELHEFPEFADLPEPLEIKNDEVLEILDRNHSEDIKKVLEDELTNCSLDIDDSIGSNAAEDQPTCKQSSTKEKPSHDTHTLVTKRLKQKLISNKTDDDLLSEFNKFHLILNIKPSPKIDKHLMRLFEYIREDKFLAKEMVLSLTDDYGQEKDQAVIIYNCIYLYYFRAKKTCFRGVKAMVRYFNEDHNLDKEFISQLYFYLRECGLVRLSGKHIRSANAGEHVIPILRDRITPKILKSI